MGVPFPEPIQKAIEILTKNNARKVKEAEKENEDDSIYTDDFDA